MLNSPFKPAAAPLGYISRFNGGFNDTHRRRADFTDARFLRDGTDLVDEGERVSEFLPARLEDRALRRRLELVRPGLPRLLLPRLAHREADWTRPGAGAAPELRLDGSKYRRATGLLECFYPRLVTVSLGVSQSVSQSASRHQLPEEAAYTHRA